MDRSEAITYLAGRYDEYCTALNFRPDDSPRGLGPSVDGAFRELGVASSADVPLSDEGKLIALMRVHFLTHALERAAVYVDIEASDPTTRAKRSQMFSQISTSLKLAQSDALVAVDPAGAAGETEMFRLNLDYVQDAPQE